MENVAYIRQRRLRLPITDDEGGGGLGMGARLRGPGLREARAICKSIPKVESQNFTYAKDRGERLGDAFLFFFPFSVSVLLSSVLTDCECS